MAMKRVDYNTIAAGYHQRYGINPLPGVAAALRGLVQKLRAGPALLEVGCGTGRWLAELEPAGHLYGLDLAPGMLQQARRGRPGQALIWGQAETLPLAPASFDMVYCVNALHHFEQPARFISQARRILRPGGVLAIVGMDPHRGQDRWYLYDYFEESYALDLARFPARANISAWLAAAGFETVEWTRAEHILDQRVGRAVWQDHFLQKQATSQLALLSEAAYQAGLARIEAALAQAEARGQTLVFEVDISLMLVAAWHR